MAAQQAVANSANKEAVVLARLGLEAVKLVPDARERSQQEMSLQTTLGPALMSTIGYGAPEVEAAYTRANELWPQVGEMPQLFTVIYGLHQYWLARADYRTCRELAEQLLAFARKLDDPALLLPAYSALGNTLCFSGALLDARSYAERLVASSRVPPHPQLTRAPRRFPRRRGRPADSRGSPRGCHGFRRR